MRVPFINLKAQYEGLRGEMEEAIKEVLESQRFILGPKVRALEEALAHYIGVKEAIGVASLSLIHI